MIKLFLLFLLVIWRPPESTSHHKDPNEVLGRFLEIFDESNLDREWLVRNILGGLAAGFGLRGTFL